MPEAIIPDAIHTPREHDPEFVDEWVQRIVESTTEFDARDLPPDLHAAAAAWVQAFLTWGRENTDTTTGLLKGGKDPWLDHYRDGVLWGRYDSGIFEHIAGWDDLGPVTGRQRSGQQQRVVTEDESGVYRPESFVNFTFRDGTA